MNTVRVIAGKLKGRVIPFSTIKHNADITPQKVKEAIFSMVGQNLSGRSFIDLFACSGQVGIEAYSRGADPVVINEKDRNRYQVIKSFLKNAGIMGDIILFNHNAFQALYHCKKEAISADIIFLDPPYPRKEKESKIYHDIILHIEHCHVLNQDGIIIVQHDKKKAPDETIGIFNRVKVRNYGANSLSVYTRE